MAKFICESKCFIISCEFRKFNRSMRYNDIMLNCENLNSSIIQEIVYEANYLNLENASGKSQIIGLTDVRKERRISWPFCTHLIAHY